MKKDFRLLIVLLMLVMWIGLSFVVYKILQSINIEIYVPEIMIITALISVKVYYFLLNKYKKRNSSE